jgi:hypothetical protein
MDHSSMDHGHTSSGNFKHKDSSDGIVGSFHVMSLESMNMKDPAGNTHHVMASFAKADKTITGVEGKISVVSPAGKEQSGELMHLGGGMYAVNFVFDEAGDWKVVCSFDDEGKTYSKEFVYPHQAGM